MQIGKRAVNILPRAVAWGCAARAVHKGTRSEEARVDQFLHREFPYWGAHSKFAQGRRSSREGPDSTDRSFAKICKMNIKVHIVTVLFLIKLLRNIYVYIETPIKI